MRRPLLTLFLPLAALVALGAACAGSESAAPPVALDIDPAVADTAVFAGGCFWCMEKPFEELDGVAGVISGFAGGTVPNPTYDEVSSKTTGHYESVEVIYDPTVVSYDTLLQVYWHNVDPLDGGGQFCDRGSPYRPAIFAGTPAEREAAEATKAALEERFGRTVEVPVLDAAPFYAAEDYHQDFYRTNPVRYQSYRVGCRRDARLDELWGESAGGLGPAL
ncbi:peptide-methionine (S)-S-oxide reductase MsrA [Rubrivirga sp. S365]|uniref:peptide-methionine (S)-S-oxide reductase MsrA n=1 Tax=Rubrivirga sp. S365 TaxID=3076080 RepID=UPI0028CA376F|nr:peptide-methionine (S)-S-oxide reductase MsrA [Rubrivirga sp. S365]MDT7855386.1 peptide-methionine (S)-S-oxide reductase MsrA [Rubrivirga sp. S365]